MQRGIPFDVKIPATKPTGISNLSEKELDVELEKGYADYVHEKSAEEVFSDIRRDFGL